MNHTLGMFTIFDSKAEAYLQPFFSENAETAKREFGAAVNGEGNFAQFAEDYALFELGEFSQEFGNFDLCLAPKHICNAITLRTPQRGGHRLDSPGPSSDAAALAEVIALRKANES